jgi:hypothetical protein
LTFCISISVHSSAIISIHPSICQHPWDPEPAGRIYVTFYIEEGFRKICPENSNLVKIGKNNKQFICRIKYIHNYLLAKVSDL